ncbi:MAG TPA: TonB-dependent receptor [Chitinophagaceae bacterium]|nr:TonB-dependent receptor [Chitinophagaceae bacterium]
MRKFLGGLVMAFLCFTANAQTKTVTGKVTNNKTGEALAGVSVTVKGTKKGTTTIFDGSFKLEVSASAKTLVFSIVGFVSKEVSIGQETNFEVSLTLEDSQLQEVVVVGYGVQKKRAVTSSIGKVSGDDVGNLATTSFDRQLAGRAAGVQVTQVSGNVSAPPRIRIRGTNSLTQGRDPLLVVDGIPSFSGGASGLVNTNVLADINPNDIESIELLKDGAATAIYGSRAANGVILITTKKGKSGKLSVNYDLYYGSSNAFNLPKLLNADQFITIANEKLVNAGLAKGAFANSENTNTNWLDVISNRNAQVQSHTLSVNGGNEKSSYFLSVNYLQQDGLIITNKNRRYNVRGNIEFRPAKYFKIGNNITLSRTEDFGQNDGGNALSGAIGGASRALPNVRVYNPSHPTGYNITTDNAALGSDANTRVIENNYTNIKYVLDKNKFSNDRYRVINNFFLEITPVKTFSIRTQASVDFINSQDFQSLDAVHGDGRGSQGSFFNQNFQFSIYTWQNYFTYNETFNNHSVTLIGGVEMQRGLNKNFFGQGTTISDPFFQSDNLISNSYANQFSGGFQGKTGFQSYFSRLNYDYKSRYFAQFSFRRDGSSRLAPAVRYGNFFGSSVGWRVSEEGFWANSFLNKIFNDFKIRGSYAEVGNELSASFPWLSTYGAVLYGGVAGIAANRIGNDKLKWEKNQKLNFGIDLAFLSNRITLTADYFVNKNNGQVYDEPQPVSLGVPANVISKNIGALQNNGFEIAIDANIIRGKDFTWSINTNFTKIGNKVKSLAEGQVEVPLAGPNNGTFNILRIGEKINSFYGYNYAGVNAANGNPMWYKADGTLVQYNNVSGAAAGYYLVDKTNPGILGAATSLGNRYIIGNPLPQWFGGITNTFKYKEFELEIFLRYQGGNKVYNLTRQEVWNSLGFVNNGTEILNRWTTPGQTTDVPKLYYGRDNLVNLQGQANSRFLEKGDFLRLQNIILSYNFNTSRIQNLTNNVVKSLRFFVQGQNLHVWTSYTGIDPENFTELGIDNSSVPQQRTFTFGLNIGF